LPLLLIIHLQYGKQHANSIIKHVPKGLGGLLIFSFVIHVSYLYVGINIGMLLAFTATMIYLAIYKVFEYYKRLSVK
jgi:hypothetical protein